jgi:hypothetical protein
MMSENAINRLTRQLAELGHTVETDSLIPGLYRIDYGPELTQNQFMQVAQDLIMGRDQKIHVIC